MSNMTSLEFLGALAAKSINLEGNPALQRIVEDVDRTLTRAQDDEQYEWWKANGRPVFHVTPSADRSAVETS